MEDNLLKIWKEYEEENYIFQDFVHDYAKFNVGSEVQWSVDENNTRYGKVIEILLSENFNSFTYYVKDDISGETFWFMENELEEM